VVRDICLKLNNTNNKDIEGRKPIKSGVMPKSLMSRKIQKLISTTKKHQFKNQKS